MGENSRTIISRLWTRVHVLLRRCRRSLAVCNALARLYRAYVTLRSEDIGR